VTTAALPNPVPAAPGSPGASPVPGELLRLAGEYLKAEGIRVKPDVDQLLVAPAARPRSKRKAQETRAARCTLEIDDDSAAVRLHFFPWAKEATDGRWLADVASALLTGMGCIGPRRPDVRYPAGTGVKGIAGVDLQRRGFKVELNAYEDPDYFEVLSDIAVTVPGRVGPGNGGVVYLADDGTTCWERCYCYEHVVTGRELEPGSWLPDPPAVALSIAGTVAAAVRTAWPELLNAG
jgi:hypothetical protein